MSDDLSTVLRGSLDAWRKTKHPRFADLASFASARLLEAAPRPQLPTSAKAADLGAWQEVFEAGDARDVPRLLAAVGTPRSAVATERVRLLATLNDPRVVSGLLALLEAPPFRAGTAQPFFRACAEALAASGDPRVRPALEDLAGRYKGIIETSIGDVVAALLARTARGIDQVKPGPLPAAWEEKATAWEALFERERQAAARSAGTKKSAARSDEELLAAIYAAPADDAPRLVFADALTERGDPRGEFITLQLARARGDATPAQQARERELLADATRRAAWALPLSMGGEVTFARGFPAGLALSPREAKKVLGLEALRTLDALHALREAPLKVALELLRAPQLAGLRHLGWIQARHLDALEGTFPFRSIGLDFAPAKEVLARFPQLRALELARTAPGATDGGEALESLTLHDEAGFSPALLNAVPALRTLRTPQFVRNWAALGPLRALPKLERFECRNAPPPASLEGCGVRQLECAWTRELELDGVLAAAGALEHFAFTGAHVPADLRLGALRAARARGFEFIGVGLLTVSKPYTPEGVATLQYSRVHAELLAESLAGVDADLAQRLLIRPPLTGPTQSFAPPPSADELAELQRSSPMPVELAWY